MNKYTEPSKATHSELLNSLPEQLRSLRAAVEQLSAHVERSQQAIDALSPIVQQFDQRIGALESNSVSSDLIKELRGEMSRLYLATQQKERLLTLNMAEVKNLRQQVTTLEATLSDWPTNSGL